LGQTEADAQHENLLNLCIENTENILVKEFVPWDKLGRIRSSYNMNPALFLPLQYACCLLSFRPASTLPPLFIVLPALFDTLFPFLCPNEET
jgi:hypothetical protein